MRQCLLRFSLWATRVVAAAAFWLGWGPVPAKAAPALRAGVATEDITPALGIPLAGYYHERRAEAVLDPLFCRALVLEAEGSRLALVTLDLIEVPRAVTDAAREQIAGQSGIPAERVMISATHTHTGPVLIWPGELSAIPGAPSPAVLAYTEALPGKIAGAVHRAVEQLQPARLSVARGRCEELTYNRRYILRDGSVGWNPGKRNPNIVRPAGPSDPEVALLYLEQPNATGPAHSLATWVNFAMHTDTTGGSRISADWPGALGRVLAGYHGPDHQTLVSLGACGNLNHLDFGWSWPQSGVAEQQRIATLLGAAVFRLYKQLQPLPAAPPRGKRDLVELELPAVSAEDLVAARATVAAAHDDRGGNFLALVRAQRILDVAARQGRPLRAEVQVLAWGRDLAWVGLPGEIFTELGLAIKQRSPFPHTLVVSLANENIGYVPDRRSYLEGNYEPESARCAAGSGEKLVETAIRLLGELRE